MRAGLSAYNLGKTPSFACQADQRFSYCLYVPSKYDERARPARVLVVIHDTQRNNQSLRDAFAEFAEESNTLVIAPLFPAGIAVASDLDNYKYLRFRDIRFDEVLLEMTAEVARRYGVDDARFALFGFSGGAHFAHRLVYVCPDRLRTVVAASPGSVTLPSEEYRWWPGLADFERLFGRPVPWERVRAVPLHLVVGSDDTNPRGIVQSQESPNWVEGAAAAGSNRVERLRTLHAQLKQRGARVTLEELPGVGHELEPVVAAAVRYFRGLDEEGFARVG